MVLFLDVIKRALTILVPGILLFFQQCSCKKIEYYSKENTTFVRVLNGLDTKRFCGYALAQRFTPTGFKVTSLPVGLKQRLLSFYELSKSKKRPEALNQFIWRSDKESSNSSESLLHIVNPVSEQRLLVALVNVIRLQLQEWTKVNKLLLSSIYGIREYSRGAVLKPHIDSFRSHILSAVINVHQDVDEPWPLVPFDHNNERHEVFLNETMDVLLYESVTVIHGRPYPLNGATFANMFIHFSPVGWREAVGHSIEGCINQTDILCPEDGEACNKAKLSDYVVDNNLIIDACDHNYQHITDLFRTTKRYLYF